MTKQPSADLEIVLLGEEHDRGSFTCGVESLDRYLKSQAGQDVRRKANAVFVLNQRTEPTRVLGYYTLCAMAISQGDVPEAARKHVPRYPLVSATLIGRLAVAKDRQGQRLGAVLLADALRRAFEIEDIDGDHRASRFFSRRHQIALRQRVKRRAHFCDPRVLSAFVISAE